jgi:hypothetical protein
VFPEPVYGSAKEVEYQLSIAQRLGYADAHFGVERQLSRSGLGSLRKVPFRVGLESPSDTSDRAAVG